MPGMESIVSEIIELPEVRAFGRDRPDCRFASNNRGNAKIRQLYCEWLRQI